MIEYLALLGLFGGSIGLILAAWKGDIWFIGVALGLLFCSFVIWQTAR